MTRADPGAAFLAEHAGRWQELLRRLIRFRSVFEAEHDVVDHVEAHIAALGLPVERVAHSRDRLARLAAAQRPFSAVEGRASLVTRVRGSGGGRSIILSAHLDIVPEGDHAQWTRDPFAAEVDPARGLVYGRGAMDDKAGAAIALAVLETIVRMPVRLRGDVVFQFVLEDETTGNGSLLCLAAGHTADAAAIIDGTRTDRLINEHAGQLQFDLAIRGRAASVSVSHLGQNAAELMAELVLTLRRAVLARNEGREAPWSRFPSPFQLSLQRIRSEGVQMTVPDRATAQCYVTFPPPFTLQRMRELITDESRTFESRLGLDDAVSITWSGLAAEPVRSAPGELEQVVIDASRRAGLPDVSPGPSTGTSDLRHFTAAGIPCVLFGPGTGYNPHRPDEQYLLSDLVRMIAVYLEVLRSWCGVADGAVT
jgi:acetylornithine deacetylase